MGYKSNKKYKRHLNKSIKIINIENTVALAKFAMNCIVIAITNGYQNCNGQNLLFNYNKYKKYFLSQLIPGK